MMVEFRVKPDKIDDFLTLARQMRKYNERQGYKVPITYRPLDAQTGKFMVEVKYESRSELQEEQQKQSSDEMWQRLIAKTESTFVPGTQRIDIL
ncbi:MAG: hypothetical protein KGJ86_20965, partial [Chloroflexota bacterium]|nr:hypothetical protein [Chloroflexota bacterium]